MKITKRTQWIHKNFNKKYFKKYSRNTSMEIFLKSNYKYKRRCPTSGGMQQLSKQKHPVRIGSRTLRQKCIRIIENYLPHQRASQKITLKLHSNLKEIISIPTTNKSNLFSDNSNTRPVSEADKNKNKNNNRQEIFYAFKSTDGSITKSKSCSSSICHAYKFRNNIDANLKCADDDVDFQHSFDKVSTITSTCCNRQKHHQQTKVRHKANRLAPVPSARLPSSPSKWQSQHSKNVRNSIKNQCLKILRQYFCNRRHQPHQANDSRIKCDHSISATHVNVSKLIGQSVGASTTARAKSSYVVPSSSSSSSPSLISFEKNDRCCSSGDSIDTTIISIKFTCLMTLLLALALGARGATGE